MSDGCDGAAAAGRESGKSMMKSAGLRWLVFVACLVVFGLGWFTAALDNSYRYDGVQESDWIPTNMWLKSAECARTRGAWLAVCDGDALVPLSEYSFGDDPGHALFLGLWSMASQQTVSLVDVARLNLVLNTAGLIVLAGFLFAIRAYVTSLVLLALGPLVYLGWIGVSPHWGLIGVTSMALILPMTLIARELSLLSRRAGNTWLVVGLVGLSITVLAREPIGLMAVVANLGVIAVVAMRRLRSKGQARGQVRGLAALGALVLVASASVTLVVSARDAVLDMQPAQRVATHNFSHTLYIGLGAVPNAFGIRYEDEDALQGARSVAPDVVNSSPEYYRILWQLYFSKLADEPGEVLRIYLEKTRLILVESVLDSAPALWVSLVIAISHFVVLTVFGGWRRIDFPQAVLIEGTALVLIGLFIAQAILAHQNRVFAMPIGAALLLLLGAMVEVCWRYAVLLVGQHRARTTSPISARSDR